MIKEAIVIIDQHIKLNNWDITLLGTVHDELIYKHPIGYMVENPFANPEGHNPVKYITAGEFIKEAMTTVANWYLDGIVEMKAEYETMKTWTK